MIKIPFSLIPQDKLYRISKKFYGLAQRIEKKFPFLEIQLTQAETKLKAIEYVAMSLASSCMLFVALFIISLPAVKFGASFLLVLFIPFVITFFALGQQLAYPKLIANRRIKLIERELLPALQDMHVELNSGVPLFNILVNISKGGYGEVSKEIGKAVKEINAGKAQIDALEELGLRNPSILFRRALWQIVNGMREGADVGPLIKDIIGSISDEQLTQIQRYGGQLSPLALFYMLIAVIAPSLGITFIIVLSSFVALEEVTVKLVFYGILVLTLLFQLMFLGMIKSKRPSLLSYD